VYFSSFLKKGYSYETILSFSWLSSIVLLVCFSPFPFLFPIRIFLTLIVFFFLPGYFISSFVLSDPSDHSLLGIIPLSFIVSCSLISIMASFFVLLEIRFTLLSVSLFFLIIWSISNYVFSKYKRFNFKVIKLQQPFNISATPFFTRTYFLTACYFVIMMFMWTLTNFYYIAPDESLFCHFVNHLIDKGHPIPDFTTPGSKWTFYPYGWMYILATFELFSGVPVVFVPLYGGFFLTILFLAAIMKLFPPKKKNSFLFVVILFTSIFPIYERLSQRLNYFLPSTIGLLTILTLLGFTSIKDKQSYNNYSYTKLFFLTFLAGAFWSIHSSALLLTSIVIIPIIGVISTKFQIIFLIILCLA